MGDPAMTNSYMGLVERNGLKDKAYPAVRPRKDVDNGEYYKFRFSPGLIENLIFSIRRCDARILSCTLTYMDGTASVSCVDSTSAAR